MRIRIAALVTGIAALAITTLSPALDSLGGDYFSNSAQAAENHNSSRSNRGQIASPGNTGKDNKKGVGIKEEGVK